MKKKTKRYKIIVILLVLVIVIALVVALLYLNRNKKVETEEVIEEKEISLKYDVDSECIKYVDELESITYENIIDTDYSDSLYLYNAIYDSSSCDDEECTADLVETEDYYLVCHSNIYYVIEDNDETEEYDLKQAIIDEVVTLDEVNNLFEKYNLSDYIVVNYLSVEDEEIESETDEEETSEEVDTSTDSSSNSSSSKNTSSSNSTSSKSSSSGSSSSSKSSSNSSSSSSSNSSSNSNSGSSSNSTTSSSKKTQDNEKVKNYLTSIGYQWDFNSKSEAEAWMDKMLSYYTGFTVGYGSYQYGDSDEAYYGYVRILASDDTCGNTTKHEIDWHSIGYKKYSVANYLYNLGYDCSGYWIYDSDGNRIAL